MMYAASWSGGKDSCLACYLAIKKGMNVSHLIHFDRTDNLHGVDPKMIALQAELTGIPLVQWNVASDNFEREFKSAVSVLAGKGIKGMIFGDIHLAPHKEWVERVCGDLNVEPIEPLWKRKTEDILQDFFEADFETIVASANQNLIDKKYVGRNMDEEFTEYLKSRGLDICGEGGEFHTFVTKGPLLHGRIEIRNADVMSRDGFWFLNVHEYAVIRQGKDD